MSLHDPSLGLDSMRVDRQECRYSFQSSSIGRRHWYFPILRVWVCVSAFYRESLSDNAIPGSGVW